jgi:hypothetical protein
MRRVDATTQRIEVTAEQVDIKTEMIKDDTEEILQRIAQLQAMLPGQSRDNIMLRRYLDTLSSYADSVVDNFWEPESDQSDVFSNLDNTRGADPAMRTEPHSSRSDGWSESQEAGDVSHLPSEEYEITKRREWARRAGEGRKRAKAKGQFGERLAHKRQVAERQAALEKANSPAKKRSSLSKGFERMNNRITDFLFPIDYGPAGRPPSP